MKSRYFMLLLIPTTFGLALWYFLVLQSFPSNQKICPEAQHTFFIVIFCHNLPERKNYVWQQKNKTNMHKIVDR